LALISPRRRARSRWAVLAVLIGGVFGAAFVSQAAATTIPAGFFVVNDQQGANDVPGQVDLTRMGRDDSVSGTYKIFMSWDSTDSWTGTGQTGDACALFDKNGNGGIDFVVCGQVNNPNANPAVVAQTTNSPYAFTCNDKKIDRCGTPSPVAYTWGTQIISGPLGAVTVANRFANLITNTDPFTAGANYPNDSTLEVDIKKSDSGGILPAGALLVNVCSYPSAGNGGNNNPFDCITTPGGGFLKIVKNTGAATTETFAFAISPALASGATSASVVGTIVPTGGGDAVGDTGALGIAITAAGSVTETQPSSTWVLSSVSCTLADGTTSTGTPDTANNKITAITVQSGLTTTCTFTDRTQPSLTLAKTVTNDSGGTNVAKDFTLTATGSGGFSGAAGTSTTSLTGDTGSHNVTAGVQYTLSESGPTGYTAGTAWSCTGTGGTFASPDKITLALGAAVTCSITNNDNPASPGGTTAQSYVLFDSLTMSGLRTGAATPGTLTFKLWLVNTAGVCSSQVGSSVPVNDIIANIKYTMATGISVTTATTYYWTVDYSGDEFNNPFSTTCGSESTTISKTE
jgi:hypothetical protein